MEIMKLDRLAKFIEGKVCGFCYPSEDGKHGEVKSEWLKEFNIFIPVCRKHSLKQKEE